MKKKKILYFANTDWYLFNFRRSLFEKMKAMGWKIVLVSPPGKYGPLLQQQGYHWMPLPFSTRSINPVKELSCILDVMQLYRDERPDIVHHFTIKCVLYGSIAAFFSRIKRVVNSVTGMGHVFITPGLKNRLLCPFVRKLYKIILSSGNNRVIFQNQHDYDYFVSQKIVNKSLARLVRGSGVNTEYFKPEKVDLSPGPVIVLFASRLIKEKGILELVEAGKELYGKNINFELHIAGDLYKQNPSSLNEKELEDITELPWVKYHGHVDDMRSLLAQSDIVTLPSYSEGTPKILLEAASMEKPIIASNIAGCRGGVIDNINGYLVETKNVQQLAKFLEQLIQDESLRIQMGKAGRKIIKEEFEEALVNEKTYRIYQEFF